MSTDQPSTTPYEQFGGAPFFEALVAGFYRRVEVDDLLRPMYPEGDLAPAERRLRMFLEQYWGGPQTYSEERGHPRLRMRHVPFPIDAEARDRWLKLMYESIDELGMEPDLESKLWMYLVQAAFGMQMIPDGTPPGTPYNPPFRELPEELS